MTFQSYDNNLISTSHVRFGFRIHGLPLSTAESYGFIRYGRDLKRDYWNNRVEGGMGLRFRFALKVFLALYVERLWGKYTNIPEGFPLPQGEKYDDFRTGLLFWHGWDKYFDDSPLTLLPLTFWGEMYSDISYYQSQKDNIIAYFHTKQGFRLLRFWKTSLDGFGVIYLMKDTNRDFWNNKIEIGPGIFFKPIQDLDLKFFVEWIWGSYFGIEGEDPNPFPQKYQDRKAGVIFWIGW